ncbi:MAG: MFS transporter [Burkholderiaceae bacterium]|nr:MFS transporter [Burkholderiaceae bacterium]
MKKRNENLETAYCKFWFAYCFSILGRLVHGMALSWVVWRLTASPLWLSAIALLSAIPSLPLAPIAGQVADRFHRYQILLITQTLGCGVAAITAYLSYHEQLSPWVLATLALLFGIISSVDGPAMNSMLVETGKNVMRAVAQQSLAMNVSRVIAPMIAVFIIEVASPTWCFVLNTGCFIPMILFMAFIKIPNRASDKERVESVSMSFWELFHRYKILKEVLPQVACLSVFIMPAVSLLPAISIEDSALLSFGSMSSGLGFGAVASAILMQKEKLFFTRLTTLLASSWVCCIAFAVLPTLNTLISQWLCASIAGASLTLALASANNAIQNQAPNMYRGRFSAMYLAVLLGLVPVGQLILGISAEILSPQLAVRGCAIFALVLLVICAYFSNWNQSDTNPNAKENDT